MGNMDYEKLKKQVDDSFSALRPYREVMAAEVRQYAGGATEDYGVFTQIMQAADGSGRPLVNMLELVLGTYMQNLVSGTPQCLISASDPALKVTASYFTIALNRLIKRMNLRESLKAWVLESMFGVATMKVGICDYELGIYGSEYHYSQLPYADPVSFADTVFDTRAERWDLIRFFGNFYLEHIDDVKSDTRNDPEVASLCTPGSSMMDNEFTALEDQNLGGSMMNMDIEQDFVRLVDVWIPRTRQVVTFDSNQNRPLRVQDWVGPDCGPYIRIIHSPIPGRLVPLSPSRLASPMADLLGLLWKDMGLQASRQKTILAAAIQNDGVRDATRIRGAMDGEIVPVNDPKGVVEIKLGGVDQNTMAMAAALREMLSYAAGNIDTLAGLSTGASTLGQEKILAANSSGKMKSMQQNVIVGVTSVLESLAWYMWHDPQTKVKTVDKVAGSGVEISINFPMQTDFLSGQQYDMREGVRHNDFDFTVNPYSMQSQTPAEQIQGLLQLLTTVFIPAAQMMAQEGLAINWTEVVNLIAEMMNQPKLKEMISGSQAIKPPGDGPEFEKPGKPANTTRTYERVRGGGPSSSGANRAMAMAMSGSGGGGDSE
jgi:hypothetical protein